MVEEKPKPIRYMKDVLAQKTKVIGVEQVSFGNISAADDIIETVNFLLDKHGLLIDVHYDPENEAGSYIKLLEVI